MLKDKLKRIRAMHWIEWFYVHKWQEWMFLMAQAKGEINKPLQFWNETLLIITYLAVIGYKPPWIGVIGVYIVVFIIFINVGALLRWLGVIKRNATLGNKENPEIQEVLQRLKSIEEKIDNV